MSSMLEQAIVDAAALREAALKNAEQAIIEKYAPEIKSAVESLLENSNGFSVGQSVRHGDQNAKVTVEADNGKVGIQYADSATTHLVQEAELENVNEEDLIKEEEGDASGEQPQPGDDLEVPLAATDGTALEESAKEDEEIMFEFTMDDFRSLPPEQEEASAPAEPAVEMGAAPEPAAEEPAAGGEGALLADPLGLMQEEEALDELLSLISEMEEEDEEVIEEEMVVDMGQEKTGTFETNEATLQYQQEMQMAKEKAEEEAKDEKEKNESLRRDIKKLQAENKNIKNTIYQLNEKLQSTLLSNAKLLYSNRVLNDASLNERQKTKIVEAINKARSVEEAKNLQETLKTTVGSSTKKGPQSLSESVQRKSNLSSMLTSKRQEPAQSDSFSERMRKLAGIN